jgi:glycosyltransferase involved in cell wall biosynthesis
MKKLLIVSAAQFGYLTDTFKYCEHLSGKYAITYVCWDYLKPKVNVRNVNVIYVSRNGNLLRRNLRLLKAIVLESKNNYSFIFFTYIRGISLFRLFHTTNNVNLDIRTASVDFNPFRRIIYNFFLKFESKFFKNVSVISEGVAKELGLKKYKLLPLGGDCFKTSYIQSNKIVFIYVGTLTGRNIDTLIEAFHQFSAHLGDDENCTLKIIGDGDNNERLNF